MAGFVYIMSNPSLADGLIKIGKSDRDPEEFRKSELNSTGVPEPFKVEYSAYVQNHHELELEIHQHFAVQRPNKSREFFTCTIMEAISAIQDMAGETLKHEDNYYAEYEELVRQKEALEPRIQEEQSDFFQREREKAEKIAKEEEGRILRERKKAERIAKEKRDRILRERRGIENRIDDQLIADWRRARAESRFSAETVHLEKILLETSYIKSECKHCHGIKTHYFNKEQGTIRCEMCGLGWSAADEG
jgi:ribosomal protein S27E